MLVTLMVKNHMHKIVLPQIVEGNYWITDNSQREEKLINIAGKDGKWQVSSNHFAKIIDPKSVIRGANGLQINPKNRKILDKIDLKEYSNYFVSFGNYDDVFILYCAPAYDRNILHLNVKHTIEFTIGSSEINDIVYQHSLISEVHAKVSFYNGRWTIENLDSITGTFVNNDKQVDEKGTLLFNGDTIFIMGLQIIIMGKSIFINNPQNKVIYNEKFLELDQETVDDKLENEFSDDESRNYLQEEETEYLEEEYFSRAPRISNILEHEIVKIDAPPQAQDREETPMILILGSSLSMGTMMLVSIISAIDKSMSGTASMKQTIFALTTAVAMLIGMILFPILSVKYDRKKKKRYEIRRQKRYKEYLESKKEHINKIMEKQRKILFENFISAEECTKIILEKSGRLWERKIEDYDFLTIRLGVGDVPLDVDIQYPEEKFTMEDDNLVDTLHHIVEESKWIKSAPVTLSLVEKKVSALVVRENEGIDRFIQRLIIQLITFQSYEDLKLVFLLDEDKQKKWEYIKILPHIWNDTKQIRFFADNYDDMQEVSKYLEEEFNNRLEYKDANYKMFMPYYLIIVDNYKKVANLKIITEILKCKENVGFSIFCITDDLTQLPNECKTFISLEDGKEGRIFENEISKGNEKQITYDTSVTFFFEKICKTIANIPIKQIKSGQNLLPNSYTFLEMYDVGRIEQLNILERWKKHDSTLSLKAPIGIDASGMPIVLDIHEKYHGPHGLIAGSTGSGKSEFIITYILSLAINYHPDDVTFVLIDYKGGGLAGAFQKKQVKLPHLVGTITNIDTNGLQRSLASIQSELRRRQIIFNEARNKIDEGTIDIYKYQKLYHQGVVSTPIPHLLIICDEFAELKQQQEEFMDELMSVSRIGRSLGVHLILATQKPAGIVNDQIRSNSKFAICLKVQDKVDSTDVIKRPDAANLKKAGQFFIQVGNDEYFTMGQSAWSGATYFPSDITEKKVDTSVEFVSNIGTTVKQLDDTLQKVVSSQGEQLTNIVKYTYELAKQNNIKASNLWLDEIPENIFVKDLKRKYKMKTQEYTIDPVIGEYDDPYNQRQGIVKMDLSNQGNTIIYGNAESGKETLLSTMIFDLITSYTTNEVQIYILDFGSEALKIYKDAPHVGDVIFINNDEKIDRFFEMIGQEIKNRKSILSDYGGDYNSYQKMGDKSMPMMVVTINNYEAFSEIYEAQYDDTFLSIAREGVKCGIVFILAVSAFNDVRYRLLQNFKQRIALQINNEDDYYNIFDKVGKKRPSHMFGRGLVMIDNDEVYEFQTAKVCEAEEYNAYIQNTIEELKSKNYPCAKAIPVMPDRIKLKDVKEHLKGLISVPIGITKKNLKVCNYNFTRNLVNICTSLNIEDAGEFTGHLLEEIMQQENVRVEVFDAERMVSNRKINLKDEYNKFISELETNVSKPTLCVIIGIDKFLSEYEGLDSNFNRTLRIAEQTDNCHYLIVENATKLKSHEYNDWYKNYISKDQGIWVGNGIDNQYVITVNSDRKKMVNNCGRSYGYVIRQGNLSLTKLIEMKELGDENE